MPTAVLMMIGQTEVMKITKIADGWLSRNAASEIGSQASGETVRSTWKIGSRPRMAHTRLSDQGAERDADDAGQAEADRHALQRGQHAPAEPDVLRAVHEERVDDQVASPPSRSWWAPAAWPWACCSSSCQTSSSSASMISGGSTTRRHDATAPAAGGLLRKLGLRRLEPDDRRRRASGTAGTASALSTVMFMAIISMVRVLADAAVRETATRLRPRRA